MVRTLDFQSKNEGSIPSGPSTLTNFIIFNKLKKNKKIINKKFTKHYSLNFTSLISPFLETNKKFLSPIQEFHLQKKVYLKQSYLILS